MSFDAKRLYELLPAIYRIRDEEHGKPLKELVSVIAEQVAVIEENLAQLYDDQFIETCAEWAVPYIGDLIGYRSLHSVIEQVRSPRAEVANTISYRRRKGTVSMLEQLARDVTGWYASVVEEFQLLATTQYMNHLRQSNLYTPDLRQWEKLEHLNTPFDSLTHTVDVRSIARGRGHYNIPNIGIFLWRLDAYSTNSPAFKLDDYRYLFSPLGNNIQLFNLPTSEIAFPALPINVPMPISRRVLDSYLDDYYGPGKSLMINVNNKEVYPDTAQLIQNSDPTQSSQKLSNLICVCNLSDIKDPSGNIIGWAHKPQERIAIDPVLGRIAFPENKPAPENVTVTYHYGFSADMGGGEYDHEDPAGSLNQEPPIVRTVPLQHSSIQAALKALPKKGIVEIINSGRYAENLVIQASSGGQVELRAANMFRPSIVLPDGSEDEFQINGEEDSKVVLNGLLISGNRLRVVDGDHGKLKCLQLHHCTLVPGINLSADETPQLPSEPSLIIETNTMIEIDHCIVGGLRAVEGSQVRITNSIVDATSESNVAYAALDGMGPGGALHIENSTIIGKVNTKMMELASNTIFLAGLSEEDQWQSPVIAERRQQGCVRFSYLPLTSQIPRRYRCQPENVSQESRVRPQFTSLRYGDAGYCQLSQRCKDEIRKGAHDEAEMGAFHELYQPQRETNLSVRLNEYLRFGLEAGIFYVT